MSEFDDEYGSAMSLDAKLIARVTSALGVVDEHGTTGLRLVHDAQRLWARAKHFLASGLVPSSTIEMDAMELATYALQLPLRRAKTSASGKPAKSTLKERAEIASEMLVELAEDADVGLIDRTIRILDELPHRTPVLDEAKILADMVNLDDFGIIGLLNSAVHAGRIGEGLLQVARGTEMRERYGYWDARLKDGFHFEPVRQIASQRLDSARKVAAELFAELHEDNAGGIF